MKKILGLLLVALLILSGCSSKSPINFTDGDALMARIDNKDTFVFVLGSSTCSACLTYKPVIEELIDNKDVAVDYVEVDKVAKAPLEKLVADYLGGQLEFTPTTYIVQDGEVVDTIVGALRYTELIDLFKTHGFIE